MLAGVSKGNWKRSNPWGSKHIIHAAGPHFCCFTLPLVKYNLPVQHKSRRRGGEEARRRGIEGTRAASLWLASNKSSLELCCACAGRIKRKIPYWHGIMFDKHDCNRTWSFYPQTSSWFSLWIISFFSILCGVLLCFSNRVHLTAILLIDIDVVILLVTKPSLALVPAKAPFVENNL